MTGFYVPEGTMVAAFYDLNSDGVINTMPMVTSSGQVYYECIGLTLYETGFFAMAIWGDDSLTETIDGVPNGAQDIVFAFLTPDQTVVMFDLVPNEFSFVPNGLLAVVATSGSTVASTFSTGSVTFNFVVVA